MNIQNEINLKYIKNKNNYNKLHNLIRIDNNKININKNLNKNIDSFHENN